MRAEGRPLRWQDGCVSGKRHAARVDKGIDKCNITRR